MKRTIGERKSVKVLAFILALALVLPMLPVMAVVGAASTIESITVKNVLGSDDYAIGSKLPLGTNSVRTWNYDDDFGSLPAGDLAGTDVKWGSRTTKNYTAKKGSDVNGKDLILTPKDSSTSIFQFVIDGYGYSVKAYSGEDSESAVVLTPGAPDKEGYPVYTIDASAFESGKITIVFFATATVTFPDFSNEYTLSGVDGYNVDFGTVAAEKGGTLKFNVNVNPAKKPYVTVTNATLSGPTQEVGAPDPSSHLISYTYTLSDIKDGAKIKIVLSDATYNVKLDKEKSPYAGNYTITGLSPSVRYGDTVTFKIIPKEGFADPNSVKYTMSGGEEIPIDPDDNRIYTIPNVIGDVSIIVDGQQDKQKFTIELGENTKSNEKDTIDIEQFTKDNSEASYGEDRIISVKPKPGYKVTSIFVYSGNDVLVSNTNSNAITVADIKSKLRVEVTTAPITISVEVQNGGDLTGKFVIPYSPDIKVPDVNEADGKLFDSSKGTLQININILDDYVVNVMAPSNVLLQRTGFDKVEWNFFRSNQAQSGNITIGNEDISLTMVGEWQVNYSKLFTLKTTAQYSASSHNFVFTSQLDYANNVDTAAKKQFPLEQAHVVRYGFFYGQYSDTLNNNATLLDKLRSIATENREDQGETNITPQLTGQIAPGSHVLYYSYGIDITNGFAASTPYSQTFTGIKDNERVDHSGIAFFVIQFGDENYNQLKAAAERIENVTEKQQKLEENASIVFGNATPVSNGINVDVVG